MLTDALHLFTSYLPSGFDSFKDAEVDEDPGQQQQEEELPPQGARLLHTTGPLQHLITNTANTSTAVNTTNFTNKSKLKATLCNWGVGGGTSYLRKNIVSVIT